MRKYQAGDASIAAMIELPLASYRFRYRALDPVDLPALAGSAWRGAFGTALKRTVCATRLDDCGECPLVGSCCFPYLFEGRHPGNPGVLSSLDRIPVPYVLRPVAYEGTIAPSEHVTLDLVLVGRANAASLYVVHALQEAGARGVGRGRGRLALEHVERIGFSDDEGDRPVFEDGEFHEPDPETTPALPPAEPGQFVMHLRTPLRLKVDGRLVGPETLRAHHVADAAVRRVSALASFHACPIEAPYGELKERARLLGLRRPTLRWHDWKRRSNRQKQTMALGGVTGSFVLDVPDDAAPLLDWLRLAERVGVGKSASMGLGQVGLATSGHEDFGFVDS